MEPSAFLTIRSPEAVLPTIVASEPSFISTLSFTFPIDSPLVISPLVISPLVISPLVISFLETTLPLPSLSLTIILPSASLPITVNSDPSLSFTLSPTLSGASVSLLLPSVRRFCSSSSFLREISFSRALSASTASFSTLSFLAASLVATSRAVFSSVAIAFLSASTFFRAVASSTSALCSASFWARFKGSSSLSSRCFISSFLNFSKKSLANNFNAWSSLFLR